MASVIRLQGSPEELLEKVQRGEATNNIHVLGFCWRMDRILREVVAQGQSNTLRADTRDVERIKSYLKALADYKAYAMSEPTPDYVQTHPDCWKLPAVPELPTIENEAQLELLFDLTRMAQELRRSASNRLKNSLDPADSRRLDEFLEKANKYVDSHFTPASLDHPETHTTVPSIPYEEVG